MTTNDYCNAKEIMELLNLGASLSLITELIDSNKGVLEYLEPLEKAHTLLEQVRDERYKHLTEEGREKTYRRVGGGFTVTQKHLDISRNDECKITVPEIPLYDLCEVVTEDHCYGCTKGKGQCKIYGILAGMCCPANNPRAGKHECEYAIKEESKNETN